MPVPKRVRAHLALLAPVAHLLPPSFTAVLNTLDEPVVLLDPKVEGAFEDRALAPFPSVSSQKD